MNTKNLQLPTQVLAVIEVFGRENIEKITQIQSEEPEPAKEIKIKQIKQLDLFSDLDLDLEVQNG